MQECCRNVSGGGREPGWSQPPSGGGLHVLGLLGDGGPPPQQHSTTPTDFQGCKAACTLGGRRPPHSRAQVSTGSREGKGSHWWAARAGGRAQGCGRGVWGGATCPLCLGRWGWGRCKARGSLPLVFCARRAQPSVAQVGRDHGDSGPRRAWPPWWRGRAGRAVLAPPGRSPVSSGPTSRPPRNPEVA